jgi:hypothetical protein
MSSISADASISDPVHDHVWRGKDGAIWATVRMAGSTLYFDSAADARAVAVACTEAAAALDRLAAESPAGT